MRNPCGAPARPPQTCLSPPPIPIQQVLLDSEGIDACDQTAQYSTQIFSLAVLLSSLFVYNQAGLWLASNGDALHQNGACPRAHTLAPTPPGTRPKRAPNPDPNAQMGGIDEAALDRLSLVVEMTKHIRVRAAADERGGSPDGSAAAPPAAGARSGVGGAAAGSAAGEGVRWPSAVDAEAAAELRRFTPSFLWLLRDFYLRLEDEHGRQARPARLRACPGPFGWEGPCGLAPDAAAGEGGRPSGARR